MKKEKDKTYRTWYDMINRCYNRKCQRYYLYGGRGITVCDKWLKSYDSFLKDMGVKPQGKSLDRKNNDKGYSKSNCRWSDQSEQMRNCSANQIVGQYDLKGNLIAKFQCAKEASEKTGSNYHAILHIINNTGEKSRKTSNGFMWKSLRSKRRMLSEL